MRPLAPALPKSGLRPQAGARPASPAKAPAASQPRPASAVPASARPTPPRGPPPPASLVAGVKRKADEVSGGTAPEPAAKVPNPRPQGTSVAGGASASAQARTSPGSAGTQPAKGTPAAKGTSKGAVLEPKAKSPSPGAGPGTSQAQPGKGAAAGKNGSAKGGPNSSKASAVQVPLGGTPPSKPANGKGPDASASPAKGSGKAGMSKGAEVVKGNKDGKAVKGGKDGQAAKGAPATGKGPALSKGAAGKTAKPQADVKGGQGLEQARTKLQAIETIAGRALTMWNVLPEEVKMEGVNMFSTRLQEQMAPEYLQVLMGHLAAAGITPVEVEQDVQGEADAEEPQDEMQQEEGQEQAPEDEEAAAEDLDRVVEEFLQKCEANRTPATYGQVWTELQVPAENERDVLSFIFEATARRESEISELVPQIAVNLARMKKVTVENLKFALQDFSGKLEELVQANENVWHLTSFIILLLFPKTRNSSWGLLFPGWNWFTWWQMTEQILSSADKFRAFDILVLVLQMMQEKSGASINQQQVWADGGRVQKVRKVLCQWGEMDEASIMETLSAYGVEL